MIPTFRSSTYSTNQRDPQFVNPLIRHLQLLTPQSVPVLDGLTSMLTLSDCLSQPPFSSPASTSSSFHRSSCTLFSSAPKKCLSLSSRGRWKCHLPFSLAFLLCSFSSPVVIWLNPILAIIFVFDNILSDRIFPFLLLSFPSFMWFSVLPWFTVMWGFVWQLLSYLLLSGAFICRMHKGWLVKCQLCLHIALGGVTGH